MFVLLILLQFFLKPTIQSWVNDVIIKLISFQKKVFNLCTWILRFWSWHFQIRNFRKTKVPSTNQKGLRPMHPRFLTAPQRKPLSPIVYNMFCQDTWSIVLHIIDSLEIILSPHKKYHLFWGKNLVCDPYQPPGATSSRLARNTATSYMLRTSSTFKSSSRSRALLNWDKVLAALSLKLHKHSKIVEYECCVF